MIKPGYFIKHNDFMDVCIEVIKVFDYGHGIVVKGKWWNMGYNNSYPIGYNQNINLKKNKNDKAYKSYIGDWKFVAGQMDDCLRKQNWYKFP